MELEDGSNDIVHPEVRAHINSLVSALGGTSTDDDGRYSLGDDALDVLRDLKKWIRFYDEKMNRMDVARCLANSAVVDHDLLQILALWTESESESKFKARLALACLEVIVPLTWPFDRDPERLTVNNYRHMPVLELAQLRYKRAIINFDAARILHTAVRAALPSMAMPAGERTPRDQGVIKLMLYFLRNIAMIAPPTGVKYDGDESQISRSALIDAFSYQDIFLVLLTIASNMGEDFRTEDVIVMEVIFHLVKRVDVNKLFMSEKQQDRAKADELVAMMKKEEAMKGKYRSASTRHSRFGTTIWVKREDGKMSTVTGQAALLDVAKRHEKMDSTKSFKPPKYRRKNEVDNKDLGPPPKLNARAMEQLRNFVEEFLDSGFNPLFQHIRRSIDRDAQHVLYSHPKQFFYLVSWFLQAERARQKAKPRSKPKDGSEEISSFNLVAGVLNQEMFITLHKAMRSAWDNKSWEDLIAVMRCFTQILLSVQDMATSGNEDDEEIADNILSRLFYEDTVHDLVTSVVRNYNHQGFEFLDAATEMTHHFVRILEAYSKKNADMHIRSKRKRAKKKKAATATTTKKAGATDDADVEDNDPSADEEEDMQKTVSERKFDFQTFAARFIPQGVVDTFVTFLKYYRELDDDQLKRVHRYFYRLAFKQEKAVMLFRVDIIHLLYNMIKGPEPLDRASGMYKEWEELVRQILKRCIRKVQERPALVVEMLFTKNNDVAYYLETGKEKQAKVARPRPAAELEFKQTDDLGEQIGIVVGALLDRNEVEHITWVKSVLRKAEEEKRAWMAAELPVPSVEGADKDKPDGEEPEPKEPPSYTVRGDTDARRTAMIKNAYLRLLMKTVGIRRLTPSLEEDLESLWTVPSEVTADDLKERIDLINSAEFNPPTFEEGVLAEHQIRRKSARTRPAISEEDSEGDLDMLFAPGGPTRRAFIDGEKPIKKTPRRRRKRREEKGSGQELEDEEDVEEKARRRREREREKRSKVKSEMYVRDSDDDSDADFDGLMAREAELRRTMEKVAAEVGQALPGVGGEEVVGKRMTINDYPTDSESGEEEEEGEKGSQGSSKSSGSNRKRAVDESEDDEEEETQHTVLSSPGVSGGRKRRRVMESEDGSGDEDEDPDPDKGRDEKDKKDGDGDVDMDEDEDEEPVKAVKAGRRRVTAGFVIDSSSDEE